MRLAGGHELCHSTVFIYRVVRSEGGRWKVETAAYHHALETPDAKEIVAYHWHPSQASIFAHSHMHLGAGIGANLGTLEKTHIPTGRIALEDVIKFAILELGVEPRRDDWREVLSETRAASEERRTWR